VHAENEQRFEQMRQCALPILQKERLALSHVNYDFNDLLVDLQASGELEQKFLDYLEK
jgi:hypothetical protein